jgi:hypothetical protein
MVMAVVRVPGEAAAILNMSVARMIDKGKTSEEPMTISSTMYCVSLRYNEATRNGEWTPGGWRVKRNTIGCRCYNVALVI